MSKSPTETSVALPAPISLTLDQAHEVAGGTASFLKSALHDYIINGVPAVLLLNAGALQKVAQQQTFG